MKKNLFLSAVLCILFSINTVAQLDYMQKEKVEKLYKTKKIVYFKFPVRSMSEISQLGKVVSVDKSQGSVVFAHADKPQFTKFIKMNYNYTVLPSPQQKKATTTVKKTAKKTTTPTKTPAPSKKPTPPKK